MSKSQQGRDLLSDLPVDLIEQILVCLPIRDAIRTSILSTNWRFRWNTLPSLFFVDDIDINSIDHFKTFVTRTLFRHEGPLHKFGLWSTSFIRSCSETDQWLIFLLRKHIKELFLELSGCLLSSLPTNFKGFLYLKTLILFKVNVPPATFQSIVAHSPLLERLSYVSYGHSDSEIVISAPNLNYLCLCLRGHFFSLCSPLLVEVLIYVDSADYKDGANQKPLHCNYTKFLGSSPNLEILFGEEALTKYLAIGIERYLHPLVFHRLKIITLKEVNFKCMDEILVVVHLIVDASAALYKLQLSIYYPTEEDEPTISDVHLRDFIRTQNCTFGKLKFVKLENFLGEIQELKFIKFLLANSPVLKNMTVRPAAATKPTTKCMNKILRYRRASAKATIVFK